MAYKTPKIDQLLEAGVHFGHQVRRWHPKMEPYIFSVKKNVHIIDLEQTEELLKKACDFLFETAKNGGQIIFVGTKKQAREIIQIEAKRCGALYVTERWIGGTLTNFRVIKKNIDKLLSLKSKRISGELDKYTKKERLLIDREIEKLEKYIGGIVSLKGNPSAVFVVDPRRERTAVNESKSCGVPVVSLIDTNSDPSKVDYVIPGNDDAIKSVALILKTISDAILDGYKEYEKVLVAGNVKEEEAKKEQPEETKADAEVNDSVPALDVPVIVTASEAPEIAEELIKEPVLDETKPDKIKEIKEEVGEPRDKSKTKAKKAKKEEK